MTDSLSDNVTYCSVLDSWKMHHLIVCYDFFCVWIDCFSLSFGLVHTFIVELMKTLERVFLEKEPTHLVCYLLSDCYLGVSTYLAPLHPLWIWPILHTKNFTTVVPLSQWCFVLTWLTLKKYTLLCLFHWPTVYLCLPKVSGDIMIRNCQTVEPSRWNKKLYQNYEGLNMLGRRWGGCFGQALLQTLGPI